MARRQALNPPVLPGYTYVRPLGTGGFSDVFLFQQDMPRRLVAVKVLLTKIDDEAAARALMAEADVMAGLSSHPSILTVYHAGVSADGRPYLVTEYCPASLGTRYRNERIPVDEVVAIGIKIASAVETAHRAGLLHRDIKPSNILVTSFNSPVLSDFGVAAAIEHGEDDVIAMSPPWSAPEVIDHTTSGTVATEVWALAATVYTLLAQRSPFDQPGARRDDGELHKRIRKARYTPIERPDVPDSLQHVLAGGMAKLPGDRYESAAVFAQALQKVQRTMGDSVTALDVPPSEWRETSAAAPSDDDERFVRGSTVPVESERPRHQATSDTTGRASTVSTRRASAVGRRIAVAAIVGGAAIVGAGVVLAVALGA